MSRTWSVGLDPDSNYFVMSALSDTGEVWTQKLTLPGGDQADRMVQIRRRAVLMPSIGSIAVVTVEIPWGNPPNPLLMGICGVLQEAAKSACPGAVVLATPTQSWKKNTVGKGNATKDEVMAHAAAIGLSVPDQDQADALCMAQSGWTAYWRALAQNGKSS